MKNYTTRLLEQDEEVAKEGKDEGDQREDQVHRLCLSRTPRVVVRVHAAQQDELEQTFDRAFQYMFHNYINIFSYFYLLTICHSS